jgi:predicted O-methyltransferase YrrM
MSFDETLDAYLEAHATPLEPLLQENYEATYASLSSPGMIAGPVLGQLLRTLVAIAAPRLVVEIGTFSGYSALAMAGGLPPDGRIITCELSPSARTSRARTSTARLTRSASRSASGRRSSPSRASTARTTSSSSTPTRPAIRPTTTPSCRSCRRAA